MERLIKKITMKRNAPDKLSLRLVIHLALLLILLVPEHQFHDTIIDKKNNNNYEQSKQTFFDIFCSKVVRELIL